MTCLKDVIAFLLGAVLFALPLAVVACSALMVFGGHSSPPPVAIAICGVVGLLLSAIAIFSIKRGAL